jgi:diaminopimelate decarboxylase
VIFDFEVLQEISHRFGDSFYLLDRDSFIQNYRDLEAAFRYFYEDSYIAYSYKTNYTPALCKIVNNLGGYAEVVSSMEYDLAKRIGVLPEKIILNGPYKSYATVLDLLTAGGIINIDSADELGMLAQISHDGVNRVLNVGIRCNFDVGEDHISRFGVDVNSDEFHTVWDYLHSRPSIRLAGFHCHFASRGLKVWRRKIDGMLSLIDRLNDPDIDYVDVGGGLFGRMEDSLKAQFNTPIPDYNEYANTIAEPFADFYRYKDKKPKLFIEPGSALSGDVMKFASKVVGIKSVRGKSIATLSGSMYNINPTLNKKNLPITVYRSPKIAQHYDDLDFGGYTCIESDYLYRGYSGKVAVDDFVVFDNAGSYSVVLKPPFILPNSPILALGSEKGSTEILKQAETFDDIFHTYDL